jgi:hypothetical protein
MESVVDSAGASCGSQGAVARASRSARWLPWIALLYALALVVLLSRRADVVGLIHDDGVYLSMARSIEHGLGPVDGHGLPSARVARYPALQPLVLAAARPLLGVASEGVDGARRLVALNGLWLAIALFAFLRWVLRYRRWPPLLALSAAALVWTLPYLLGFAQHLMSESLFLVELAVAVLLVERAAARGRVVPRRADDASVAWSLVGSRGALLAAGLVAGLMPATRAAGSAIVAGLALHLWLATRNWRSAAWFFGAALVPWFGAAAWSAASVRLAIDDSPLFRPKYLPLLLQNLGDAPWITWVNVARTADQTLNLFAASAPPADGAASASIRLGGVLLVTSAMAIGALRMRRERRGPELLAAAAALALVVLPWPFAEVRFLVPIAPLLVVALVETTRALVRPRAASPSFAATLGWSGLFLALAAWNAPLASRCFAATREQIPYFAYAPIEAAPLRECAGWLAANTPPDAVFASTLDPALNLLCHRPGVSLWLNDQGFLENYAGRAPRWRSLYAGLPDADVARRLFARAQDVLAEYRRLGVRHVVVVRAAARGEGSAGSRVYDGLADHLVRSDPVTSRAFRLVFTSSDRSMEIWSFDPAIR